ncbi:MAG: hypothetical protein QW112_03455 [Candidatus Micrarchaeia archaeon]
MCELCEKVKFDNEFNGRMSDLYTKLNDRLKTTRKDSEAAKDAIAFSTMPFPLINFAIFEPRMPLQLPSSFYQNLLVDGKRLRNDWSTGWMRFIGFQGTSLFLVSHAFKKHEEREILLHTFMVEFGKGEWTASEEENKITISVRNIEKQGINFLTDLEARHTFSFSFIHQDTGHAMIPRDRVESSSLVKPLAFDYTSYVVTVPHLAPHAFLHQDWKKHGYGSAMDMQNAVTGMLKSHI